MDFKRGGRVIFTASSRVFAIGALWASLEFSGGEARSGSSTTAGRLAVTPSNRLVPPPQDSERGVAGLCRLMSRAVSSDACHWPLHLLVRHLAEGEPVSSEQAVQWLAGWPLLAPGRFTVQERGAGGKEEEEVVERGGGRQAH